MPNYVLYIVKSFPTIPETFIINQINSLIRKKIDIEIYSYEKGNFFDHDSLKEYNLLEKTIYHQKYPESKMERLKTFLFWLIKNLFKINFRPLFQILKRKELYQRTYFLKLFFEAQWFLVNDRYRKFDVIHAHFGQNGERIAKLCKIGIFENTRLIVSFHGFDLIPDVASRFSKHYPNIINSHSALTVNTKYLESLLNSSDVKFKSIFLLPVGLDTSYFKRIDNFNRMEVFRILFCGRLIPLKGPDIAIQVLEKIITDGYSNCELTIIGDGILRKEIDQLVYQKGLKEKVSIMGSVSQTEVRKIMNESSVLIMPGIKDPETSRAETQGLVIQEAQSMELPVIVSDVGGMKYGLINQKSGFVVPSGNIEKFAERIEYLIKNPTKRKLMGEAGRSFVRSKYDSSKLAVDLINIYKSSK